MRRLTGNFTRVGQARVGTRLALGNAAVRIPYADEAVIDPSKLLDYLLSRTHPLGRHKARFFYALGYGPSNWTRLDRDLRFQHLPTDVARVAETRHGTVYEIRAILRGPSGASAGLVSVWIVRHGERHPSLVTAYPGGPA